jgi:hypothetical protein
VRCGADASAPRFSTNALASPGGARCKEDAGRVLWSRLDLTSGPRGDGTGVVGAGRTVGCEAYHRQVIQVRGVVARNQHDRPHEVETAQCLAGRRDGSAQSGHSTEAPRWRARQRTIPARSQVEPNNVASFDPGRYQDRARLVSLLRDVFVGKRRVVGKDQEWPVAVPLDSNLEHLGMVSGFVVPRSSSPAMTIGATS